MAQAEGSWEEVFIALEMSPSSPGTSMLRAGEGHRSGCVCMAKGQPSPQGPISLAIPFRKTKVSRAASGDPNVRDPGAIGP